MTGHLVYNQMTIILHMYWSKNLYWSELIQNVLKRILKQNLEIEIFSRYKFFPGT